MALGDDIAEQYPFLAFLANDPQVGPLLRRAVDQETPYSEGRFTAELMKTDWWRKRSDTQREWQVLVNTRPGEARRRINEYRTRIAQASQAYGVRLPGDALSRLARGALSKGFDPEGPEMLYRYSLLAKKYATYGARRTAARQIGQIARSEYFYPMSRKNAAVWGDRIARGLSTVDDVRVALSSRAQRMFPQFADALAKGETMDSLTDNYRNIIAEELELDPERIDLSKGRWSRVLGMRDKDGNTRPMTNLETLQLARQDERWWRTGNGKQIDAEWTNNILRMFGRRPALGIS